MRVFYARIARRGLLAVSLVARAWNELEQPRTVDNSRLPEDDARGPGPAVIISHHSKGTRLVKTRVADVLTIEELSLYLKVPRSTLYKLAQESRIPAQKVGRQSRFSTQAIDRWLEHSSESGKRRR